MRAAPVVWPLLVGLVTLGLGQAAWGHASLVKSSPSNGATLSQSPSVIRAWFSEELAVQGSVIRLYDSQQKLLATGGVDTSISDHTVLKIAPAKLHAGSYSVAWHAVSADDKAVRQGSFRFSVSTGGQAPSPMSSSMTGSMSSQTPDVPPLAIVNPADHARLANPLTVVIETTGDIATLTMGNNMAMRGMGPHIHLHVLVDSTAMMPAATQLAKVGPNRYAYKLGHLAAGPHTIKVFWADNTTHAAVGPVHTVTCTVGG
ncbi:MAG TPA: copper resistance CopC family protein [bacterium]|nr:copper resistance CopC family protein [bacterium]